MLEPTGEPRQTAAEPTARRDLLSDDAIVAHLRAHAPGMPTAGLDPHAVTAQARGALRRRRRNSVTAAAIACLTLALTGQVSVPGLGTVSMPGGDVIAALGDLLSGEGPGSDQRHADVDRLEAHVLPVVEELELSYYLLEPGPPCRILEHPRGDYRDGDCECEDLVPFDAEARADFHQVTDAVERSGVAVDRIFRHAEGIYVQLADRSWRYIWHYVYMPDVDTPPATTWPGGEWTHIRGGWWLHRAHDD